MPHTAPTEGVRIEKYCRALRIKRIVFAIRKRIVYTIHGTSSDGLSCKENKFIEIFILHVVSQICLHQAQ